MGDPRVRRWIEAHQRARSLEPVVIQYIERLVEILTGMLW